MARSPNPVDQKVGERIREVREGVGLDRQSLADRAGIEVETLSRIESGTLRPSSPTIVDIARALGIPVLAIFDETSVIDLLKAIRTKGGAQ